MRIKFKNFVDSLESFMRSNATAPREYIFPDKNMTIAGLDDLPTSKYRGGFDLSGNAYPTTGGSGTAGALVAGDHFYVSVAGDVEVTDLGIITLYFGAMIWYIDGDPTEAASWIVKQ